MKKTIPIKSTLLPDNAERQFKGIIYDVFHWQQEQFDASYKTFEMLRRADTVTVIAVVDGKLAVIEDEQPHSGMKLSFPGGRVDDGELNTLDAAKREMHEETGYSFNNWRLIKVRQPQSKIEWFIYTYIAWGVTSQDAPHLDAGEKINLSLQPFEAVKQLSMDKVGYLGELAPLFETVDSVDGLLTLPEFQGREVDR